MNNTVKSINGVFDYPHDTWEIEHNIPESINIVNIEDYTHQQIFDFIVRHLAVQGRRSIQPFSSYTCAYRGDSGLMCAVGAILPFGLNYKEGRSVLHIIRDNNIPASNQTVQLLYSLQKAHDSGFYCEGLLKQCLSTVAKENGLQTHSLEHYADLLDNFERGMGIKLDKM